MKFNLVLLVYTLINTVINYIAIHFQLNKTNVLEVLILLITYKLCVPNKREHLNIHLNILKNKI